MKNLFLGVVLLTFLGCATTIKGPLTGKVYSSGITNEYIQEIVRYKRKGPIDKYLKQNPQVSEEIQTAMKNVKVIKGMNKEQVALVINPPIKVYVDKKDPSKEGWFYSGENAFGAKVMDGIYYYFEKGLLINWEKEVAKYLRENLNLDPAFKQAILENKVIRGMNKEQVLLSWGVPIDLNKTVGSWGVHEQWIYERNYRRFYLYFENDKLTSWQEG
jgi:hypothetical protein